MMNKLDKYYTKQKIANKLTTYIYAVLKYYKIDYNNLTWIEPSAGEGVFVDALEQVLDIKPKILCYDIDEDLKNKRVIKQDFLKVNLKHSAKNIIFGNPPFGRSGQLAIDFINKASKIADIVCFIVPNTLRRYSTQKKLNNDLKLIVELTVDQNAFEYKNKTKNFNCSFQIWVNKNREEFKDGKNLRLLEKQPFRVPSVKTFIYNNTKKTVKFFDKAKYKWDVGIPRQGFCDYSKLITDQKELKTTQQYMFIKYNDELAKKVVELIDFEELSHSNTIVPGFSTTDFIKEYNEIRKLQGGHNYE